MNPSSSARPAAPRSAAGEGTYAAVCVCTFVFLCTLPLTGVPDEALAARFAGFAVTGMAAGWMSANGGAALLGLTAGHGVMLLLPETAPAPIGQHAYPALAAALLGGGMWAGDRLRSGRAPRRAAGASFAVPEPLLRAAGVAAGLFPFAFARPAVEGVQWTLGIPIGFVAMVLLGVLSPGDPHRVWRWFLLGHSPFLLFAFALFIAPGLIDLALTWFGLWWGSALAANAAGAAPKPVPSSRAPVLTRGGGRMG